MKPEIKEKWIEALLSGEYLQGRGRLKVESESESDSDSEKITSYCCLGVLCELALKEGLPMTIIKRPCSGINDRIISTATWFDEVNSSLPESIKKWSDFGISYEDMVKVDFLIRMNDIDQNSFEEIAEYIRVNL